MSENAVAPEGKPSPWTSMKDVLLLRATREQILAFGDRELAAGALVCWIAGMGRWWDDPTVGLVQKLGLGSVAYPYVLGSAIWLLFLLWRLPGWRYKPLLAYIALTGAPGMLYALPVELLGGGPAALYNGVVLLIVASWRVRLLYRYFQVVGLVKDGAAFVGTALPISGIVAIITYYNLASGVIAGMGGFRGPESKSIETGMIILATLLLVYPFPFIVAFYFWIAIKRWWQSRSGEAGTA